MHYLLAGMTLSLLSVMSLSDAEAKLIGGRVNMEGAILGAACTLDVGSDHQAIELSPFPHSGTAPKSILIKLVDCSMPHMGSLSILPPFHMTLDGEAEEGLFSLDDTTFQGLDVQLSNSNGIVARPGMQLSLDTWNGHDVSLTYALRRVQTMHALPTAGENYALRLIVDYF